MIPLSRFWEILQFPAEHNQKGKHYLCYTRAVYFQFY